MSHRIITTIRDSQPRSGGLHFFPHLFTTGDLKSSTVVILLLHGIYTLGCRLRKISTTLATITTTTGKRTHKKSRTTLHKQVGFSSSFFFFLLLSLFFFFPWLVRFLLRETLYGTAETQLIGVAKPRLPNAQTWAVCRLEMRTRQ